LYPAQSPSPAVWLPHGESSDATASSAAGAGLTAEEAMAMYELLHRMRQGEELPPPEELESPAGRRMAG
jgi:hypothetical protein